MEYHILIEQDDVKTAVAVINADGYDISEECFGVWDKSTFPKFQALEVPNAEVLEDYINALQMANIKFEIRKQRRTK